MQVILLENVAKVGQRGDVVKVKDGYAQNFLIPHKLAKPASAKEVERVQKEKRRHVTTHTKAEQEIARTLLGLDGAIIKITRKANASGNLFAKIHEDDIAKAIVETKNVTVSSAHIQEYTPIKEVGTHTITLSGGGVAVTLALVVEAL